MASDASGGLTEVVASASGGQRPDAPETVIDADGVFKYIVISCDGKLYVRGKDLEYHVDILDHFAPSIGRPGTTECVGGGRMRVSAAEKHVLVYGYSRGFGRADHSLTAAALRRHLGPEWEIETSDEGY